MPEMSDTVSSGADKGLGRNSAGEEAAALLRTAATALLSAADIWSTGPGAPVAAPPTMPANLPEPVQTPTQTVENTASGRALSPSQLLARFRPGASGERRPAAIEPSPRPVEAPPVVVRPTWPPRKLALGLQGGGAFGAFTWGALERLLEERSCEFEAISGASIGAINASLLACGLVLDGRDGARRLLTDFWTRMTSETSFRSLMLLGAFSPPSSSVAFGPTARLGRLDPSDLVPLREALIRDIDFSALRASVCPKLMVAATRVRDGRPRIFGNAEMTADVLLASTCPALPHCAVDIEGEAYWDGGYAANPPIATLARDCDDADILIVQVTPARDAAVPLTSAAIDRRLDQIAANAVLNAEIAALEWIRGTRAPLRIHRIAAEDEVEDLAQMSPVDLGRGFVRLLRERGYDAADRWLRRDSERAAPAARRIDAETPEPAEHPWEPALV
jgi:NTE family protein